MGKFMLTISIFDLLYFVLIIGSGLALWHWQKDTPLRRVMVWLAVLALLIIYFAHVLPIYNDMSSVTSGAIVRSLSVNFHITSALCLSLLVLLFPELDSRRWEVLRDLLAALAFGLSLTSLLGNVHEEHYVLAEYFSMSPQIAVYVLLLSLGVYIGNSVKHYRNRLRYHHAITLAIACFSLSFTLYQAVESQKQRELMNGLKLEHNHLSQKFELHWTSVWQAISRLRERIKLDSHQSGLSSHEHDAENYTYQFESIEELLLIDSNFETVWHKGEKKTLDLSQLKSKLNRSLSVISMNDTELYFLAHELPILNSDQVLIVYEIHQPKGARYYLLTLMNLQQLWAPLLEPLAEQGYFINVRLPNHQLVIHGFKDSKIKTDWQRILKNTTVLESQLAYRPVDRPANITNIGQLILFVGMVFSLLLGTLIYFYFVTRRQASFLKRETKKRRRMHDELEIERNRTRLSASVSKLGVWEWNVSTGQLLWDEQMHEIYETPKDKKQNLIYEFWRDSVHPDDIAVTESSLQQTLEQQKEWDYEFRIITPAKRIKHIKASARPVFNEQGEVETVVGGNMDVTHQRELEQRLKEAKEQAELASKTKSAFLANMSHEIRTPMNGVIGITELLQNTGLTKQQNEYLQMISSSANALLTLLNDILDISKIEAGQLEIEPVTFAFSERIGNVLKSFAPTAHGKGVGLDYYISPSIPDCVVGDPLRISQVLFNLVGNAIKFTDKGGVTVEVLLSKGEPKKVGDAFEIVMEIVDTGKGISLEQQNKIFDPFQQADTSTTRQYGGTGLGLTIVKQLLKLMNGHIEVKSEPNIGSKFVVTLPLKMGEMVDVDVKEVPWKDSFEALSGARCLVVDDNEVNRRWLLDMTASWGCDVVVAHSASDALAKYNQAIERGKPFQIMLLDNHMPGMSGIQLVRELKNNQKNLPDVVIMLSSSAAEHEQEEIIKLGIQQFLIKPVKQSEVFNCVFDILATGSSKQVDLSEDVYPLENRLNVLVAEDNLVNQRVVKDILELRGHSVTLVGDGKEAVYAAKSGTFDAILMDVQMPEMDGLEATRKIREYEATHRGSNWIIGLTANALKGDRERCLEAGMNEYIPKPINAKLLVELLETGANAKVNHESEQTRRSEISPHESADSIVGGYLNYISTNNLFDRERGMMSTGENRALMSDMVSLALELLPEALASIEQAHAVQDKAELARQLHKTKGMVSNFTSDYVTEMFEWAERQVLNDAINNPTETIDLIKKVINKLMADLKEFT